MLDNITSLLKDTEIKCFVLIKSSNQNLVRGMKIIKFQISLITICGTFITFVRVVPGRFYETYVAIITFLHYILKRQSRA